MAKAIAEGADIRAAAAAVFVQRVEDNAFHHWKSHQRNCDSAVIGPAFSGRAREISWLTYLLAIVLVVYFVFVQSRMG